MIHIAFGLYTRSKRYIVQPQYSQKYAMISDFATRPAVEFERSRYFSRIRISFYPLYGFLTRFFVLSAAPDALFSVRRISDHNTAIAREGEYC